MPTIKFHTQPFHTSPAVICIQTF